MASIFFLRSKTDIDYSLVDGRVRSYIRHDGECMYDESRDISVDGWEKDLIECVIVRVDNWKVRK